MKRSFIISFLLFIQLIAVKSQVGNEFWFAAPDISYDHASNSVPLYLCITAQHATTVTVSRPADDSFTPIEFAMVADETKKIKLDNNSDFGSLVISEIETYAKDGDADDFIQAKGFLIESSDGEITACYSPDNSNNSDIVSLKAENALGCDFWVSTQRKYRNFDYYSYDDDYNGFTVVATEDNSIVTIYPNDNTLESFETDTAITVTLNKGECFAMQADLETGREPENHIFGIHVTSTKDIAIIIYDDSMCMDDGTLSGWDIMADQIVPTNLVGYEYIALRGWVWDRSTTDVDGEAVFVTPTVDGTDIYIDGTLMASDLDAGEYFEYTIEDAATHIRATQPAYVNHVTGYANKQSYTIESASRELGGAILPSVDLCVGSYSVTVRKEANSSFKYYFNKLIVRCDTSGDPTEAIKGFTYYIDDVSQGQIDPDHFTFILDSAFAYYNPTKAISLGDLPYFENVEDEQTLRVENSNARFHFGVVYASKTPGCRYAYFSDFAANNVSAGVGGAFGNERSISCGLDSVQLVAYGGTSYKWTTPNDIDLVNSLNCDTIADPLFSPDTTGTYVFQVDISGECFGDTTIALLVIVGQEHDVDFILSDTVGCSPLTVLVSNTSENIDDPLQLYTFSGGIGLNQEVNQDTIPLSLSYTFPKNQSDTIQKYTVSLRVSDEWSMCYSEKTDTISILPGTSAIFEVADTQFCAGEDIQILEANTGDNEVLDYTWYFSDGTQSTDEIPQKTFENYTDVTQVKSISLKIDADLSCNDSVTKYISVLPQIASVPNPLLQNECTPASILLQIDSVLNVTEINWLLTSPLDTFSVTTDANTAYTYVVDSLGDYSREYTIQAFSSNEYGCVDTSSITSFDVYQTPSSDFSFSDNPVESGEEVVVYNESSFSSKYLWSMGDSTSEETQLVVQYEVEDSTGYSFSLIAYNSNCSDTSMKTLQVYPEISSEDTIGQSGSGDTTGVGGTGIENTGLSASAKVYLKNEMITVGWPYNEEYAELTLIDMSGRQRSILSTMLSNGENVTDMSFNANEIYLLQVKTDKRTLIFKVTK